MCRSNLILKQSKQDAFEIVALQSAAATHAAIFPEQK
jgi:hypothetical protein